MPLPITLTIITTLYHFLMRIAVGETVTLIFRKHPEYCNSLRFRQKSFEPKLYEFLKVRKWKRHVITAKPHQFNIKELTPDELLFNINQAETVHWIIIVLSYLPLLMIIPFGEAPAFIITSVIASLIDLEFVFIQRYNRPRVERLCSLVRKRNEGKQ